MMKKFKKQKLTKKQLEIMKILWNSPTPMIASDIEKSNPSLNINTIQACLRALMKAEAIYGTFSRTISYLSDDKYDFNRVFLLCFI